jgi:threonine dehydrogenase-like Zn-dependent dehydrogenase
MKAVRWYGKQDVRTDVVEDPEIINPRDAVIRVTLSAICGSDLHLYNGWNPAMKEGDILGHEFMGEVMDVGAETKTLSIGNRVVVPFAIACGQCFFCRNQLTSLCTNSNPEFMMQEKVMKYPTAGLYGYSHLYGGYAGGQAQYVRIPYADVNTVKVPDGVPDEKALFVGDIFSTGYQAAEQCGIKPGQVVAVWGCGPVGLFAIKSAFLLKAGRVIAIDRFPDRLALARKFGAETVNYETVGQDLTEALIELTGGRGPDHCIDAVGMEAHGPGFGGFYDKAKQTMRLETDRPNALREAMMACRPGGTLSIPGVYTGFIDKVPMGIAFGKGLTLKMGQTHVHRYMKPLLERIQKGEIDPSEIITHRIDLQEAPQLYKTFNDKEDGCVKVVIRPEGN